MAHDVFADGLVVFAKHAHDFFGLGLSGKVGEAAQIAEDDYHVRASRIEEAAVSGVLDDLSDLRGEKSLQSGNSLRTLLRQCQLAGHLIESVGEALKFITGGDIDPVTELAGADPRRTFLKQPDGAGHSARE